MSRESQKWIIFGCDAVVGGWGVTALLLNLFQCDLPTAWIYANDKKCIDRTAFWTYYSVTNIITDIAIIVIICGSVLKIQTSWSKKILVMSAFGSCILYVLFPQLWFKSIIPTRLSPPPISLSRSGKPLSLYSWSSASLLLLFASPASSPSSTAWNPARSILTTFGDRASLAATAARVRGCDIVDISQARTAL
jgi:hypothetical protein